MSSVSVVPGRPIYGHAVGILMQNDTIVRLPGDVGNGTTFDFPVRYSLVKGVAGNDLKDVGNLDRIAPAYVDAAVELEREGVRMLAAGCGFSSILQPILADAVSIPVLTSSLVQVPLIGRSMAGRAVGILTANSKVLDDRYFQPLGWTSSSVNVRVWGIEDETELLDILVHGGQPPCDLLRRGNEIMSRVASSMIERYPEIGAIVMECTNLPPFASAVSAATGLPVFDIVTLIRWGYWGCVRSEFRGYC